MKNKTLTIVIALLMLIPVAAGTTWVGEDFSKQFTAKPEQGGWVADAVGEDLVFGTTSIGQNYPRGTAISDNGKYAATNFNNGRPGLQTTTHDGPSNIIGNSNSYDRPLAMSENGEYLFAVSLDTNMYSYEQGTVESEWNASHSTASSEIATSADGEFIIIGTDGGMIHVYARFPGSPWPVELWNASAGASVTEVDISADGLTYTFAAGDMVKVYNVYGNLLHTEELSGSNAKSVAISDDGNYVVLSDSSAQIFLLNGTDSWNTVTNFPITMTGDVPEVAINCDGSRIIVGVYNSVTAVAGFTNPTDGTEVWGTNPLGSTTDVVEIDMTCDGEYAAVAVEGGVGFGEIWLVDFEDAGDPISWQFHDTSTVSECNSASISDDGQFIVATCTDSHYIFTAGWDGWGELDNVPIWSLETVVDGAFDYSEISNDGRYFAYTLNIGVGTASEVVQSAIPRPPTAYTNQQYAYKYIDMSEDGEYIIAHGSKGAMVVYSNLLVFNATQDPMMMSPIIDLDYNSDGIGNIAISPNGTLAAYHYVDRDTGDDVIKSLSIPSGNQLGEYQVPGGCIGPEESDIYISDETVAGLRITATLCDDIRFFDEAMTPLFAAYTVGSNWQGMDGSKDGTTLIGCYDRFIYVFDVTQTATPDIYPAHLTAAVQDCEMDDNSMYASFTDDAGNVGVMTLSSGATTVDNIHPSIGLLSDISEDGAFITTIDTATNKVFLHDRTSMGAPVFEYSIGAAGTHNSLDWAEDGSRFIAATDVGVLLFEWGPDETWDATDATPTWAWDACDPVATASEERIAWADDCGRVYWKENTEFPDQGSLILLWNLENGREPLWAKVPPKVQSNNTYWAYDIVVGNDGTVYVESRYDLDNGTTPFILYAWDKFGAEKWNITQEDRWWFSKQYYPVDSRSGLDVAANHSLVIALDEGFAFIDADGNPTLLATQTCDDDVMGGQAQFAGTKVAISCYPSDTTSEYHMFDLMCSPHPCGGDWSYDSDTRAYDVQVTENNKYVVFANGTQVIFRSTSNDVLFQKAIPNVRAVAVTNDGKVAMASSTHGWKLYDKSGELLHEADPLFTIYGIDMDRDGHWMAISGWNSTTGAAHMQIISLRLLEGFYTKYEVAVSSEHTPPSNFKGGYHSYEVHIAEGSTKVVWSYSGAYNGADDDSSAGFEYWYAPSFQTFEDFMAFKVIQIFSVMIVFIFLFGVMAVITRVYSIRSEGG
jgi:hypothetical protein